jgi:lipase maturation factor 1
VIATLQPKDPTWRRGDACAYHYETQPLPTPLAFHARLLPRWFHKISTAVVLALECAVPLLAFGPRRARLACLVALEELQALIAATGNFAYFNLLSAVITLSLRDPAPRGSPERLARRERGTAMHVVLRRVWRSMEHVLQAGLGALALGELIVRLLPPRWHWAPLTRLVILAASNRVVASYGLFANMTVSRPEIVVEGSDDGREWRPYEFPHKPGDPHRRPRWTAPHQPRLDWQMWFAALQPLPPLWFMAFLQRLLEGSPAVLALLQHNPFPAHPPRYVRAVLYDYRMTDRATRRQTGQWWRRERVRLYFPPVALA